MGINSKTITIEFANEAAAEHFASWLCGSGEQQYWQWMEYREEEENGDITALQFEYHRNPNQEFVADGKIYTKCGRRRPNFDDDGNEIER